MLPGGTLATAVGVSGVRVGVAFATHPAGACAAMIKGAVVGVETVAGNVVGTAGVAGAAERLSGTVMLYVHVLSAVLV
jgi:hypothetical protein